MGFYEVWRSFLDMGNSLLDFVGGRQKLGVQHPLEVSNFFLQFFHIVGRMTGRVSRTNGIWPVKTYAGTGGIREPRENWISRFTRKTAVEILI